LIHIAPPIALALRRPKLLWYNGTTGPNSIIEKPRILSMYRKSRRTIIRRRIKDIEGVILTDCLDRGYIHAEEIGYIGFRNSWAECVGNVIFTKVVRVMGGPQSARVAPIGIKAGSGHEADEGVAGFVLPVVSLYHPEDGN
jgi:hypothetical protein